MGVMMSKTEDDNVELTEKINADLRAKMQQTQDLPEGIDPDFADAEYLEGYEKKSKFSWIWFVLVALALASLVFIIIL